MSWSPGLPAWKWRTRACEEVRPWADGVGVPPWALSSNQHPCTPTVVQDLQQAVSKLEARLSALEKSSPAHRATTPQTQVRAHPHQGPPAWR